jgi:type IV secretory system VirB8-like protein
MKTSAARTWVDIVAWPVLMRRVYAAAFMGMTLVALLLAVLLWRAVDVATSFEPYIVRIYPDGHTEGGLYNANTWKPQPDVLRFFLQDFTVKYFSRVKGVTETGFPKALLFLSDQLKNEEQLKEQQTRDIQTWLEQSVSQDAIEVSVAQVEMRKIDAEPMEAVVQFSKISKSSMTGLPTKPPEDFTAQIHFRTEPKRQSADVNPLGFQITYIHVDRALRTN